MERIDEIVNQLNAYEDAHPWTDIGHGPEPADDIWGEVIRKLPEYSADLTDGLGDRLTDVAVLVIDGRKAAVERRPDGRWGQVFDSDIIDV